MAAPLPPPRAVAASPTTASVLLGVVTTALRRDALAAFLASAPTSVPLLVVCDTAIDADNVDIATVCDRTCVGINDCRNAIVEHAIDHGYGYVGLADDDVVLGADTIQRLHLALVAKPAIDVLSGCYERGCYSHRFVWGGDSGRDVSLEQVALDAHDDVPATNDVHVVHVSQNLFVARTAKLGRAPFDARIHMHEHEANFMGMLSAGIVVAVMPSVRVTHNPSPPSDVAYAATRHREAQQLCWTCINFAGSMYTLTTDSYALDCVKHTVSLPYQQRVDVPLDWADDADDESYYASTVPECQILILIPTHADERAARHSLRAGWLSRLPNPAVVDYRFVVQRPLDNNSPLEQRADILFLASNAGADDGYKKLGNALADAYAWCEPFTRTMQDRTQPHTAAHRPRRDREHARRCAPPLKCGVGGNPSWRQRPPAWRGSP